MKRLAIALLMSAALLSGCNFFAPETGQQTLAAENALLATELVNIRATATAYGERLSVTMAAAETAVRSIDAQSTRISATLMAQGTAFVDTSRIVPPTPSPSGAPDAGGAILVTPQDASAFGNQAPPANIAPQITQAAPTPAPSSSPLSSLQVAAAVGADDCPLNPTTTFTQGVQQIYATAIANGIGTSNVVSTRWLVGGSQVAFYEWTPGFTIEGACIWFNLPASAVELSPGSWSVEFAVDGASVGNVTFTIAGDAMDAAEVTPST